MQHSSAPAPTASFWNRRWAGTPGRLEVWYATLTDRGTGTGMWLHGELVAPHHGGEPHRLAWAAVFRPDQPPAWHRTPAVDGPLGADAAVFDTDGFRLGPDGSTGSLGPLSWDLSWDSSGQNVLATFPPIAWHRELLPGAQVVPAPDLAANGWLEDEHGRVDLTEAHAAVARIYGHGSAERWAWLHADLGEGDLLEVVTAVSTRPGLNRLPPVAFIRFRLDGRPWPASPFPAVGVRTRLGLPRWSLAGRIGRTKVRIEVDQPSERNVSIDYHDPDGRTATCVNTERADVTVELLGGPHGPRRWTLAGTGHAEVGTRP